MADVETGGGSAIQGNANAGKDFIGRDQKITTTIYESADNVAAMRHQLARLEDNSQWRLAMLEQKIDNLNDDFQTFRNSLLAGYVRLPNNEPPNQTLLIVMISVVIMLILLLVGLAVYWSIRQPLSSPQAMLSSALLFVSSTTSTLFIYFW